ncbi:MAG: AAC(3) family N-acetyltransferase [Bacteroidota bacterium]|jgi:aminoglycoside 3-N-acetyltransferase|nr:AAC(3) family N-acetyltransferase [Ignavibacteria bacterium]MCU7497843.1 AAC(3) family N-acetyltransferase [Ignavibacteria bacterium]MCU7511124.1 AAC(3) family N-acetyltransferase [Ignavibacteria bacterium]MCU7518671.1 AAC(3) family N-acetyltransferase [Ignavibacteria bacterium]MCU7522926.1 AAC(3) family N-acetyltransferase [Ignavibacteria bacterium]
MGNCEARRRLKKFLTEGGLRPGQNIIVHASFRKLREEFPEISPEEAVSVLKEIISCNGSVIFPAFTYSFKKPGQSYDFFDRLHSQSKTGILSEVFRTSEGVIRTSSPTHSFSLWGKAAGSISFLNSPSSPLGHGSVIDWLAGTDESYVLMLGADFTALTIGHYIENISGAEYLKISPWNYLNVLPCGVSDIGEQALIEVPGCSRSFTGFERHLLKEGIIKKFCRESLNSYFISIPLLIRHGISYLRKNPTGLLCPEGACSSCNERHVFLQNK